MDQRPKIKIRLSIIDFVLEGMGWMTVAALWIIIILNYSALPDTIPVHYSGADGHVDKLGAKAGLLALPIIATILFFGMTTLNSYPHIFNHPVAITVENAERQYRNSTRLIRFIKFAIPLMFLFITFQTMQIAMGRAERLGAFILPGLLIFIFVPILISIVYAFRNK